MRIAKNWFWLATTGALAIKGCRLEKLIDIGGLEQGIRSLADFSGESSRVIGSLGHEKTLEYITKELESMSHIKYWTQPFNATYSKVLDSELSVKIENEWRAVKHSGFQFSPGIESVVGNVVAVEAFGCRKTDYHPIVNNKIVLVQRGFCLFSEKVKYAKRAGALATIIYSPEDSQPIRGTLGEVYNESLPTFGISNDSAIFLMNYPKVRLSMKSMNFHVLTKNIIAQTVSGDSNTVIMAGAHSDSVPEGPGIHDNGAGCITLLNVAKNLKRFQLQNAIRFAWWSAEEEGLLGSDYYTNHYLSPEEINQIQMYLNFDMIASPNYVHGIYNGHSSIKQSFSEAYEKKNLFYKYVPLDGRSDYFGFAKMSIRVGGLFTGAEKLKTQQEHLASGGTAAQPYDSCYHKSCDDSSNLNLEAWLLNSKVAASVIGSYSNSLQGFPQFRQSSSARSMEYHGDYLIS